MVDVVRQDQLDVTQPVIESRQVYVGQVGQRTSAQGKLPTVGIGKTGAERLKHSRASVATCAPAHAKHDLCTAGVQGSP